LVDELLILLLDPLILDLDLLHFRLQLLNNLQSLHQIKDVFKGIVSQDFEVFYGAI
jgi:hypothetical protein